MEYAFWLAALAILYSYFGYPALIALAARLWPAPPIRLDEITPEVSLIIIVRNAEAYLTDKLRNVLALDYPRTRLEILVVSDGSTDGTDAVVADFAGAGVRLLALSGPRGKAAALDQAVPQSRGEILVFTDARQPLARDAVKRLVAYFADPTVGAVSGELHILTPPGAPTEGVGLYWRYEKLLRRAESQFDSTVGVTGAIYALRRELFVPLDARTILDDVAIPMEVVLAGRRVLFAPEARAWDSLVEDPGQEYRRKVRTLAGNFQLLVLRPAVLDPFRNRLLWQLASHKLSRLLVPWCLVVLLVASAALSLSSGILYRAAFVAQLLFYLLAAVGDLQARRRRRLRLTSLPYAFVLLNLAAVAGLFGFLRGTESAAWRA